MASILNVNGRWRALIRRGRFNACRTFGTEDAARAWATAEERRIKGLLSDEVADPKTGASRYQVAGVYMLLRGSEVRYVGRSVHIYRRLADHERKAMEWDSFQIWPCSDWIRAAELEKTLIRKYQPPLNVALTNAAKPPTGVKGKRKRTKDLFTDYVPVARKGDDTFGASAPIPEEP